MERALANYMRLPFFSGSIPGAVMESLFAYARNGKVLNTYDFVDVIDRQTGWQVKSTKEKTPVTWKRAKLPNAEELIDQSLESEQGLQVLGDAIIDFCNEHAVASIEKYELDAIAYVRLVVFPEEKRVGYFERQLCTRSSPRIFLKENFAWQWSQPKNTQKKEQLESLIGTHRDSGTKWFAWHGKGENQLHFSGEQAWWPQAPRRMHSFSFPDAHMRLDWQELLTTLAKRDNP